MKLTICKASVFVYVALFYAMLMAGCQTSQIVTADYIAHEKVSYSQSSYQENTNVVQVKGGGTADLLNEYKVTMQDIGEVIAKLRQEKLRTFSAIERISSDNTKSGYVKAVDIIKDRIFLQNKLLEKIDYAEGKYVSIARAYPTEWNNHLNLIADDLEDNMDGALSDIRKGIGEFERIFDIKGEFVDFEYMAKDKVMLLSTIRDKCNIEMDPENPMFKQLRTMVKLGKNVDTAQMFLLQYTVCTLELQEERLEIKEGMSELGMVNYVDVLLDQRIDAGNMRTAFEFAFVESLKDSLPSPSLSQTQAISASNGFTVEIEPNKGLGGIYNSSKKEKITFTLKASRDCWFILLHIDTNEEVKQLCPNKYYNKGNFLRANTSMEIPGDMPYKFVASPPYGIDEIWVIVSDQKIDFDPRLDQLDFGNSRDLPEFDKEFGNKVAMRGIEIQPAHGSFSQGGSYDKQFFNPNVDGNAVMVKTFIRVVPGDSI